MRMTAAEDQQIHRIAFQTAQIPEAYGFIRLFFHHVRGQRKQQRDGQDKQCDSQSGLFHIILRTAFCSVK